MRRRKGREKEGERGMGNGGKWKGGGWRRVMVVTEAVLSNTKIY